MNQNRNQGTEDDPRVQRHRQAEPGIGLLSRILIRSPMMKAILPARLRHRSLNDLIFIGENHVHLKQILPNGQLLDVGTNADFPSQIRSAAVLGVPVECEPMVEHELLANEPPATLETSSGLPPQILVLALESPELRFLAVNTSHRGEGLRFHESSIQLPVHKSMLRNPGKFLVIDPLSRALAVAASHATIMLYGLKDFRAFNEEYLKDHDEWNPISHERQLNVEGPILAMDFINPDSGNQDHVVLVVVTASGTKNKLGCYEWNVADGPQSFRTLVENFTIPGKDAQNNKSTHCSFIVPMEHLSVFLLVQGSSVVVFRDVLTGVPQGSRLVEKKWDEKPRYPASASRRPAYVAWSRCHRSANFKRLREEALHLVREDGTIHYITRNDHSPGERMTAGSFDCHVGASFTNFIPNLIAPDYLIATGCMSAGQILSIGENVTTKSSAREETMQPKSLQRLPNWSAITDLVIAQPDGPHGTSTTIRPVIHVTSGRQPHGAINELRIGVEAKVTMEINISVEDEMIGAYRLWALPDRVERSVYVFLTYPGTTTVWKVSLDSSEMSPLDSAEECEGPTVLAALTRNHQLIQVTESALAVQSLRLEELISSKHSFLRLASGTTIVAADFHEPSSALVLAARTSDQVEVHLYTVSDQESGAIAQIGRSHTMPADVTCITLFEAHDVLFAMAGLRNGSMRLLSIDLTTGIGSISDHAMEQFLPTQSEPIGESIVILHDLEQSSQPVHCLVLCGLRDGNLYTTELDIENENGATECQWGSAKVISMGTSPVGLRRDQQVHYAALATCGQDTCRLLYSDGRTKGLTISSIWFTDSSQPDYAQPSLSSLCTIPSFNDGTYASNPDSILVSTDGRILRFATLDRGSRVVPRERLLKKYSASSDPAHVFEAAPGTPQKILYLRRLNAMIVASLKCEVKMMPNSRPPVATTVGRRINRAIIQFTPQRRPGSHAETDDPSTFIKLLPAERVTSMLEWECQAGSGIYHYVLIGTHISHQDGRKTGRLLFFSPRVELDGSIQVELRSVKLLLSPVRALAVYDETKIVLSGDSSLAVYEFKTNFATSKPSWTHIAKISLPSHGTHITVSPPVLHVTTSADSVQAFKLVINNTPTKPEDYCLLEPLFGDSLARATTTHFPISIPHSALITSTKHNVDDRLNRDELSSQTKSRPNLILVADKYGTITGISHPQTKTHQNAAKTFFEISLPQCVTHFTRGPIRPPWFKNPGIEGIIADDIIGSCTDGTIYAFSIINNTTRIFLKFLENLCAWDERVRLETGGRGFYHGSEDDPGVVIDPERQFGGDKMRRKVNYSIRGDTLERFLERDGDEVLLAMLEREVESDGGESGDDEGVAATRSWKGNARTDREKRFKQIVDDTLRENGLDRSVGLSDAVVRGIKLLRGIMTPLL